MAVNKRASLKAELYGRCKKYRADNKDGQWEQAAQYLWGDQNIRRVTEEDQNDFVVNICYKQFHIMQSMLCRNVPGISMRSLIAGDPQLEAIKDELQLRITQNWKANEILMRMVELTSNGLPFGSGYFKVTWDGTMRMGLGDIRIEVPDTRNIFFLPGIGSVRKSLIMYERKIVDKLTALHMFPDQKDAIDTLFKFGDAPQGTQGDFTGGGTPQYATSAGYSTYSWSDSNSGRANDRPHIELVEEWSIDPTTLKMVPELFGRIEKTPTYKAMSYDDQYQVQNKKLYPRGRLCIFSGSHEFTSGPNPFPSFPYMQFAGQLIPPAKPGDEYPMGLIDQEFEIQDMFNTRNNQMTDALDHTAMGGFGLARKGAVDIDEFNSKPRRMYATDGSNPGEIFQWYNPPSVPPEAFKSLSDIRGMGDDVLNIHGIVGSGDTKDIRSGQGVAELTELANRVQIVPSYSLESCFSSLVRYQIHMMGSPYYRRGIHYSDHVDLSGVSPDAFDITITAGLNLPMSKTLAMQTLFRLQEGKVIDGEDLLENVDSSILPNKEQAIQKLRARTQAGQAMASQQAQADVEATNAQAQSDMYSNVVPMQQGGA